MRVLLGPMVFMSLALSEVLLSLSEAPYGLLRLAAPGLICSPLGRPVSVKGKWVNA